MTESTQRSVFHADGLEWLANASLGPEHAIVTSLPDASEFPKFTLPQWREWFSNAVSRCCERSHPQAVVIFYQTDIKREGTWVDKSYLVHRGAEEAQSPCLWHKIVCRVSPGLKTFGRPAYGHLMCFSKGVRIEPSQSTPDVIDGLGLMTWSRATPMTAAVAVCEFLRSLETPQVVVDPFCGRGTMLAVANHFGLDAIGVEISKKRAKKARNLVLDPAEIEG